MLQSEEAAQTGARSFMGAYQARLADGWLEDEAQERAVGALNQLLAILPAATRPPKGLYLHGPVGRGKSQLLSLFVEHAAPVKVRRTHMHTFMGEVHQRIHEIKSGDPVRLLARSIADECRVLGFDEFYVTNIADGILLGRLFEHLFKNGVVVVSTSNWPMDELFQNGRNRKGFLPFIRLLKQNMNEIDLGDGTDYRRPDDPSWPLYVIDGEAAQRRLQAQFDHYAGAGQPGVIGDITAKALAGRTGWYRFADICRKAVGRKEYLELIQGLDTLLVQDVPCFGADDADAALRFVTLIDICYDQHRRVIVSAAAYPDELYAEGPVKEAFRRAASRLAEMQTWAD